MEISFSLCGSSPIDDQMERLAISSVRGEEDYLTVIFLISLHKAAHPVLHLPRKAVHIQLKLRLRHGGFRVDFVVIFAAF